MREQQSLKKQKPSYDGKCRDLSALQINELLRQGVPHCVRLKVKNN